MGQPSAGQHHARTTPRTHFAALPCSLLELHIYYRAVSDRGLAINQRSQSNLVAHMMQNLENRTGGAHLYVGHDTNLDGVAVMLDLAWNDPSPYPANASVPGGIIKLTASGSGADATVTGTFLYSTFDSDQGILKSADITFSTGAKSMPLADFQAAAKARIDPACTGPQLVEER
jgi:hypothetical protein